MRTFGAFEAKNRLSELLELVEHGEEVMITKHGRPVAKLVGVDSRRRSERILAAIESLKNMPRATLPEGVTIKDLINEGRRH
jgi:prevent-host-death family protein